MNGMVHGSNGIYSIYKGSGVGGLCVPYINFMYACIVGVLCMFL